MMPAPERVIESPPAQPAKVFSLAEWKEKMVKEQNNEPDENLDKLEKSDLIVRLLELTTKENINEDKLRKILKFANTIITSK
jgi:regulator of sirC expression with transglutaminase-like and TPR domain